jgi:hypothetical protein
MLKIKNIQQQGYKLDVWENMVWCALGTEMYFFSSVHTDCQVHPASYSMDNGGT